ncbi:Craniofacial development protein 2 [Glycine soja]
MDQLRNNVNARSLPGSNALYGSSTVSKEQGPLHRRPDVVKSKQGFSHFRERVWVKKLVHDRRIRFGTWNIGTLTGKSMEIVDVMVRRKINFMCLQETKWTGEKAKELDNSGFKLWYTGKIRSRNGVGIIVDKEWKKDVVDVRRVGDRIIVLKLVVGQDTFNVISGYAPQVGLAEHFKVKFWEDLEGVLQDIPQGEKVFLGGDLNGHVGSVARGFEGVHGGFGLGEMNGEGKSILEFSEALDLSIANTWFKKREEHLITYKSGGTCSQIDFFLIRKSDRKYCLNCKVIPGESLTTQHRVLVMDVRIRDRTKRRSPMVAPRIKWWHLKGEKQGIFQQKIWEDDIVLLGESREELNERLETWRRALETHGFRLSRSKLEYMECKFNKRMRVSNSEVKIGDHIIHQVTRFKYLGSVIQDDGEIEGDVNHRIQAGWMKWRKASGVLCDAKVPIKLKGKFYRTAVRPAILYGTECWAVKSQHENKVGVAEMRMLRWMCGKTRQDKIRNEAIRERVGVAPIVEKMVENRLRWFGHVERRPVDSVVRRVDQMERRQTIRGRGRPKKTIREVIKKDLELNDLDRSMVLDRTLWRKLIHVADPT